MPIMPKAYTGIGFEIVAVQGYRPLDDKLLIKVKLRDNPVELILMSPEVGKELIKAINQADAMVQKARLSNKEVH